MGTGQSKGGGSGSRHPRTKIIATVGPASRSRRALTALLRAGVNVFRLNFSHGTHEEHEEVIARVRHVASRVEQPVAILADLQGPRIRVSDFADPAPMLLKRRETFVVVSDPKFRCVPGKIGCTYAPLSDEIKPGEPIMIDDGKIELKVLSVCGKEIQTRVVHGGELTQHKGMNLPKTTVKSPSLTPKDLKDLKFALGHDVDYIALSFVRTAEEIVSLRARIQKSKSEAEVIAKIERPEAVKNITEIVEAADGVMVARGDLGVELGPAAVPPLQKQIIRLCVRAAKPVITATQMLESMIDSSRPTRAEASDVSNAIYDGTSAVMLSAETAVGRNPVLAVRTMVNIARRTESVIFQDTEHPARLQGIRDRRLRPRKLISEATVMAAARAAIEANAKAVVTFTESGRTAKLVARERLATRIFALTPHASTYRRLALHWGIIPRLNKPGRTVESMRVGAERSLLKAGHLRPGDRVIFIAGYVHAIGATNMLQIVDVEAEPKAHE